MKTGYSIAAMALLGNVEAIQLHKQMTADDFSSFGEQSDTKPK